jgi:hypothetical protein
MKSVKFDCGCEFPAEPAGNQLSIQFDPDIEKIPLDCQATWDLISSGNTVGVFQVETQLGQKLCKDIKPQSIKELADIGALARPACLEGVLEKTGKTIVQSYIDRKNGLEPIDCFHPALEEILKPTQGVLIAQEQAMQIAQKIAGFSEVEADNLRKAAGKKDTKKMAEVKTLFLEKAKELKIVTEKEAEEIFSWIEKSQRYAFNFSIIPETVVQLKNNITKQIKDINIGDWILGPTNNKDEFIEVTNKYDHGEQEVYEIVLENGNSIRCTLQHKFLCEDGIERQLQEILEKNLEIMCQE